MNTERQPHTQVREGYRCIAGVEGNRAGVEGNRAGVEGNRDGNEGNRDGNEGNRDGMKVIEKLLSRE